MKVKLLKSVIIEVFKTYGLVLAGITVFLLWFAGGAFLTSLGSPLVVITSLIAYGFVTIVIVTYIIEVGKL